MYTYIYMYTHLYIYACGPVGKHEALQPAQLGVVVRGVSATSGYKAEKSKAFELDLMALSDSRLRRAFCLTRDEKEEEEKEEEEDE
jgi:hypothetical protein